MFQMRAQTAKRKSRIPQLKEDAKALGVERSHLYRVLRGQRTGAALLARYQALQASKLNPVSPTNP
jgi:hypothetical protein